MSDKLISCDSDRFATITINILLRIPDTPDIPWNQVSASIWTDLEPSVAMLAACMPIMRPLLHPRDFIPHARQTGNPDDVSKEGGNGVDEIHNNIPLQSYEQEESST